MMERIQGGCTLWARKTLESDIFCSFPATWFKVWFYIVSSVAWKDGGKLERGTGMFTLQDISAKTRVSFDQSRRAVSRLRKAMMIATQKTTRGMLITVLNYDRFQDIDNYKSHDESHGARPRAASEKPNHIERKKERDIGASSQNWGNAVDKSSEVKATLDEIRDYKSDDPRWTEIIGRLRSLRYEARMGNDPAIFVEGRWKVKGASGWVEWSLPIKGHLHFVKT